MTILEAIAAAIEPYSVSDEALEKEFIDAQAFFKTSGNGEDDYTASMHSVVALAAMSCLNRLRTLTNENIGGISQSYDTAKLIQAIKGIARRAGLSPLLVLDEDETSTSRIRVL